MQADNKREETTTSEYGILVEDQKVRKNTGHETEQQATVVEIHNPESPINSRKDGHSRSESSDSSWEADDRPRRSTRARRRFDPNHMPSGSLEMKLLNDQIDNESSSSESEKLGPPANGNETVSNDNVVNEEENDDTSTDENVDDVDISTENILPGACMAMTDTETSTPVTWRQAINTPEWQQAMKREVNELENKQAWEIVPRPENVKVLPGVWNFRINKDENGNIVKYKARWCVDGSRERFIRPPEKVFSPVAEMSTIRMLLAIAGKSGQLVLQAGFPNAYINADIEEEIYVCQPKGLGNLTISSRLCPRADSY